MKSMTGFAYTERQAGGASVCVEIKSYNSRFLEIFINLNTALSPLEPRIRAIINERCKRGKIEVNIRESRTDAPISINVNAAAVGAYGSAIAVIKSLLPSGIYDGRPVPLETFLSLDGVIEIEKGVKNENEAWDSIKDIFFETLEKFEMEREREGCHTEENILSHLAVLERLRDTIASFLPRVEQSIKENLKLRFAELALENIDENRVLAETSVLLMKYTIAEELSRLSSHLAEFRAETARNEGAGKKLDFISQEINREINTIGSKTPLIEVSRSVIEMKDALENIREQLRNVE
jgi:uncharacterized protein (TIGR00255 family)